MWIFALTFLIAVWVFVDARQRKDDQPLAWALGTFLLLIVCLPYYLAKRNLKAGEVREGGTAWNLLKGFAAIWTLAMLLAGLAGLVQAGNVVNQASSEAEQAGAAIGSMLGLGLIGGLWFVGVAGALLLGLLLKKSSVVEQGPTGALAEDGQVLKWE